MTLRGLAEALNSPRPWIWATVVLCSLLAGQALPFGGDQQAAAAEAHNSKAIEKQTTRIDSLEHGQQSLGGQLQWQGKILEALAVDACLKATTTEAAWRRLPCQQLGVAPRGSR